MTKPRRAPPSQLMELFFSVARTLGLTSDRELASLANVTADNVVNWRDGTVRELKTQTLNTIIERLSTHIRARSIDVESTSPGLTRLEIEQSANPSELQREFNERVAFDYIGHRFLYYEPQGALAWERLIGAGYDQGRWVSGVLHCLEKWLETHANVERSGPLAQHLELHRGTGRALEVLCLGVGDGSKELPALRALQQWASGVSIKPRWLCGALVDVSIPLLLLATQAARQTLDLKALSVMAFCSDFEEGKLDFLERLPATAAAEGSALRLVTLLGNTFGNLRDEEGFVRTKLGRLARAGDLVWLEVALKLDKLELDPLYRLTQEGATETAADTSRRMLLEGPFRRWEAALGRRPTELEMKVWVRRDDDSCRVPKSVNFCHDLVLKEERRGCTMLYSRRYVVEALSQWFEALGYSTLAVETVNDSRGVARVANVLLKRVR